MDAYTWASSTLDASRVGTFANTAVKLFHVRIAEGKYAFWWLCILENGIWNFWSWSLVVLVVAGVRYICDCMGIRWWTILYSITIFVLVLHCCKVGHSSSFSILWLLLFLSIDWLLFEVKWAVCQLRSWWWVRIVVFNVTFSNISAISRLSVLLVRETGVPEENHRHAASHW